jgi:hypothetical protein
MHVTENSTTPTAATQLRAAVELSAGTNAAVESTNTKQQHAVGEVKKVRL